LFLLAATAMGQSVPLVIGPQPLNDGIGPCGDARVAAADRGTLALGWTVADGPQAGVWLRWRVNYLVDPPMRLTDGEGASPRDLEMAFDSAGRLHAVWTELGDGVREVRHARVELPGGRPSLHGTLSSASGAGEAESSAEDADFPALLADGAGGMVVAWQQARGVNYSIQAATIESDGTTRTLGSVSGGSLSGLNPQILTADPLRIAWHEIDEFGGKARVDEWHADEGRWRPSVWEELVRPFEPYGQVLLHAASDGAELVGCWQQSGENGGSFLVIGRTRFAPEAGSARASLDVLDLLERPGGVASAPCLSAGASMTLAWQLFLESGQAILMAPLTGTNAERPVLALSRPDQRFASLPDQTTVDQWSAVVWVDEARDGGDGNLYMAEVTWPGGR
jgi:hypothetical protein